MDVWQQVVISTVVILSGITVAIFLLKFATRDSCFYRLEGIQDDGDVVEVCDHCQKRRVFVCQPNKRVRQMMYTRREWEDGKPGTEVTDGQV